MKERLRHRLRAFLIGISFPIVFSSGCAKDTKGESAPDSIYRTIVNEENLESDLLHIFKKYFDSEILEYNSLESLLTDEEIAEVIQRSKTTKECDYQFDGDIETLENTIKANSIQYLKKHSEYESAFLDFENDYDLVKIENDFETAFYEVFRDFLSESSNNINEDLCRIQTLKIVFSGADSSSILGKYMINDNVIVLNYQSILEMVDFNHSKFLDEITLVLDHELNHVRQSACEDRIEKGQKYESFDYIDNVCSFLLESSAESSLYNIQDKDYDSEDYTYYLERKLESLFFLFAICNENADIEDYYNAIYDTDLEKFYDFFGCETEEDIYELYKIWGSIDAAFGRNPSLVNVGRIETIGDAEKFVGYDYKINLLHHVLANMVDYTCRHSDFSLKDNLTLFKIVKTILIDGSYTVEENETGDLEQIYDPEFVSSFKEKEDFYYGFLGYYYDADLLEMKQIEEDYVNDVMDSIVSVCDINDDFYYCNCNYYTEAKLLLQKFPLLEPICKANYLIFHNYDSFVEDNAFIYQKKK